MNRKDTKGKVIWLTGKPCSGKTTISLALFSIFKNAGIKVERLDGDIIRKSWLCEDLGFSKEDRRKNLERVTYIAELLMNHGIVVLCSFVSPYRAVRGKMRDYIGTENFIEIHVDCTSKECSRRDVKGMWKKAEAGIIREFTGFDAPYEAPQHAEIVVKTDVESIQDSVNKITNYLKSKEIV